MTNEQRLTIALHRAILELDSIHTSAIGIVPSGYMHLIESSEGLDIVEQGMKLLVLKDLSDDSIRGKSFND